MRRSGFMLARRTVSRPSLLACSPADASKAKPHTTSRSKPALTASTAASRTSSAPTVPYSGPSAMAARFDRSPSA